MDGNTFGEPGKNVNAVAIRYIRRIIADPYMTFGTGCGAVLLLGGDAALTPFMA